MQFKPKELLKQLFETKARNWHKNSNMSLFQTSQVLLGRLLTLASEYCQLEVQNKERQPKFRHILYV